MTIDAIGLVRAYQQAARLTDDTPEIAGANFGSLVEGLVSRTADTLRQAEAASAAKVAGEGNLVDVVTAIGAAETALETMVAVRDRVVGAYQEIMRMQI